MKRYTVATIPGPHTARTFNMDRAKVTDALDPVPGSPVVGGGNETCRVRFDGQQWIVEELRK